MKTRIVRFLVIASAIFALIFTLIFTLGEIANAQRTPGLEKSLGSEDLSQAYEVIPFKEAPSDEERLQKIDELLTQSSRVHAEACYEILCKLVVGAKKLARFYAKEGLIASIYKEAGFETCHIFSVNASKTESLDCLNFYNISTSETDPLMAIPRLTPDKMTDIYFFSVTTDEILNENPSFIVTFYFLDMNKDSLRIDYFSDHGEPENRVPGIPENPLKKYPSISIDYLDPKNVALVEPTEGEAWLILRGNLQYTLNYISETVSRLPEDEPERKLGPKIQPDDSDKSRQGEQNQKEIEPTLQHRIAFLPGGWWQSIVESSPSPSPTDHSNPRIQKLRKEQAPVATRVSVGILAVFMFGCALCLLLVDLRPIKRRNLRKAKQFS